MTKEQLIDQLTKTLSPIIESFADQPSPAAAAMDDDRKKLEKQQADMAKVLDTDSAAYAAATAAIDEELKGLKVDIRTQRKQNLQLAAEALVHVGNTLRVPLKLKDTGRAGTSKASNKSAGGKRTRKSNAEMQQETQAVLKALPSAKKDHVPKGEIAEKVGFDPQSALLKLKRDGLADSNGVRGAGGGWRKSS